MTRDETIAAIAVMQAYVDGKDIEAKWHKENHWLTCQNPTWRFDLGEFRVRPEPRVIYGFSSGSDLLYCWLTEEEAKYRAEEFSKTGPMGNPCSIRKFIEVLD